MFGVILGLSWGYVGIMEIQWKFIGVVLGLYWGLYRDNGKEHGDPLG